MEALISVIVPVYKVEKYLDRCVESIVAQSYHNLEIILVDDGSPDCCGQMCDNWVARDQRISAIHKKNGGLSDARNAGVEVSSGEYVVFVDSDDFIAVEMIERLYRAAMENDARMALCNVNCVDEAGGPTGESEGSPIKNECLLAEQVLPRFYQAMGPFYIVAWNKLYHRSLLSARPFPIGKWHEDEFVAAQMIWRAKKIACIDYLGYNYVTQRAGSIMQAKDDARRLDALEALLIRYRFYQEIGQEALLFETRSRVYTALESFNWNNPDSPEYRKMMEIRQEYAKLTGLTLKERIRWRMFEVSPGMTRRIFGAGRALKNRKNIN